MAIYRTPNRHPLANFSPADMYNNQVILYGTDPEILSAKGVFFLDTLVLAAGETVTINDGEDNLIVNNMLSFSSSKNHLRCDYGIKITGNVVMAKGYLLENVLLP